MSISKKFELVTVVLSVVFSAVTTVLQSVTAVSYSGFTRWISIGGIAISPWALLAVSVCCAGVYLVCNLCDAKKRRAPLFTCAVAITSMSAVYILVLLSSLLLA